MTYSNTTSISAVRRKIGITFQGVAFALILSAAGFAGWQSLTAPSHIQNYVIILKPEEFGQNSYGKLCSIASSRTVKADAVKILTGDLWDGLTAGDRMAYLERTTISGWHGFTLLVRAEDDSRKRAEQMGSAMSRAAIAALNSSGWSASPAGEAFAGSPASVPHVYILVAVTSYVFWYLGVCLAGCRRPRLLFERGPEKLRYALMASIAGLGIAVILLDPHTRYSHALPFFTALLVLW